MVARILLLGILLFGLNSLLFSQPQASIQGRILDSANGEAIEYASVTLHLAQDSSLLYGVVTDAAGNFIFTNLQNAEVYLSAQFLGYETYNSAVFQADGKLDLGIISLGVSASVLREVEVRSWIDQKLGR